MDKNERDDYLAHYGVLGMHWGKHTSGGHSKSKAQIKKEEHIQKVKTGKKLIKDTNKAEKKIIKKEIKNEKLEKRIVKNDMRTSTHTRRIAKKQTKMNKYQVDMMSFNLSNRDIRKAKRVAKSLAATSKRHARIIRKTSKYKKKIYKNKKVMNKMNTKIEDLSASKVALGKKIMDEARKED